MNNKIIILYLGDVFFDARCINMSLSLISKKYDVTVLSTYKKKYISSCLKKIKFISINVPQKGFLKYLSFYNQINKILKNNTFHTIISGDLYSLASAAKHKKKANLIYDCREIYTDLYAHKKNLG